jgi:hypothetical protein
MTGPPHAPHRALAALPAMSSAVPHGQTGVRDLPPAYCFVIRWPVRREEIPGVTARAVRELHGRVPGILVCNLAGANAAALDAVAVDTLARVALAAQRCRWTLRLDEVPAELAELIAMMGLTSALPPGDRDGLRS